MTGLYVGQQGFPSAFSYAGVPLPSQRLRYGFQLPQGLGATLQKQGTRVAGFVSDMAQGAMQAVKGLFAPVRDMVTRLPQQPQGRWWLLPKGENLPSSFVPSAQGQQATQTFAPQSILGRVEQAFETALKPVLKWEGGFSNHPSDTGGATNMGITHEVYRKWLSKKGLPQKNVKDITKEEVRQIYYENYWVPSGANQLAQTNLPLAVAVFNAAVNMGVGRAKEILQRAGQSHVSFLQEMENLYRRFASRGGQGVFLKGWLNRNNDMMQYTQSIASQLGMR